MTKSNGIASLKQAARLLNKHSPDGESLAYINPEEARLLKSHGGSGIQTLQGVPSYASIFGWDVPFTGDKDWGKVATSVGDWLGYGGDEGGGKLAKDLASLGGGYLGYKEAKELTEWEKEQYEKQQNEEALNKILFGQHTDSGKQLLAPTGDYKTIEDASAWSPVSFNGATTPDLTTTATVAEGGRIGYNRGRVVNPGGYNGELSVEELWTKMMLEDYELTAEEKERVTTFLKNKKAQGGRIGYQVGTHPLDADAMAIFGNTYNSLNAWQQTVVNNSKAQGGRIGAFNGGIQGLMPQQGFMPQPGLMPQQGLNPRMGYALGGPQEQISETENFNWGGPDVVETANMREEALFNNPIFDRDIQALEKEQTGKFEDLVAQEENKKRSDIQMRLNKYRELVDVEATGGRSIDALIKVAQGHGDNEVVGFLMQFIEETGPLSQNKTLPMGAAYGGRIGAAGGGIMPLLNMGGMEKDYRQDGGFVPIGRKEKADDVPARLSKNEFVFTADAVRAAGGGDIDEGAQRMYNVMKNLEAGGDISEQSQGKA